jgi:hypothetical protein
MIRALLAVALLAGMPAVAQEFDDEPGPRLAPVPAPAPELDDEPTPHRAVPAPVPVPVPVPVPAPAPAPAQAADEEAPPDQEPPPMSPLGRERAAQAARGGPSFRLALGLDCVTAPRGGCMGELEFDVGARQPRTAFYVTPSVAISGSLLGLHAGAATEWLVSRFRFGLGVRVGALVRLSGLDAVFDIGAYLLAAVDLITFDEFGRRALYLAGRIGAALALPDARPFADGSLALGLRL